MRYIRYLCIAIFALALVAVAMANRELVTVKVLPPELAGLFAVNPETIPIPMFVVIFASIIVGLAVGFVWEWLREQGIRSDAAHKGREMRRLQRENNRLKAERKENQGDEVLALLDEAS